MDCSSLNNREDQLSKLPDEILLKIMSSFTTKEAARNSVLSHQWRYLWQQHPVLDFEDSKAMQRISDDTRVVDEERRRFASRVNRVMDEHMGPLMDVLRISFCLDISFQSHIDKWVNMAITKQVKRLELDLTPVLLLSGIRHQAANFTLPHDHVHLPRNLTSLCLKYVNVTTQLIECLLQSCQNLESLSIVNPKLITRVRVSNSVSLRLRKLELIYCHVDTIDICVPMLVSFTHSGGKPCDLHIRNASSLRELAISAHIYDISKTYFGSLWEYFSQLTYLALDMRLREETNRGIRLAPTMTNLKHLLLHVHVTIHQTLIGWVPLIEASPVLEKLTIKLYTSLGFPGQRYSYEERIHSMRPLKRLKTLEIMGFTGWKPDLDLATNVIMNASVLEEVIVYSCVYLNEWRLHFSEEEIREHALCGIKKLESKLPSGGAKLIHLPQSRII